MKIEVTVMRSNLMSFRRGVIVVVLWDFKNLVYECGVVVFLGLELGCRNRSLCRHRLGSMAKDGVPPMSQGYTRALIDSHGDPTAP